MAYNPNNNPYVPGDPYSYDLKWIVDQIKTLISNYDGLEENLTAYIDDYLAHLDLTPEIAAQVQEAIDNGAFDDIFNDFVTDNKVVLATTDQSSLFTDTEKAIARKNIAAGNTNPNLLDNPYFGASAVNQRGFTSFTSTGDYTDTYTIDRWLITRAALTKSNNGLAFAWNGTNLTYGNLAQKMGLESDNLTGRLLTASCKLATGEIYAVSFTAQHASYTAAMGPFTFEFIWNATTGYAFIIRSYTTASTTIEAAKLELGDYSTLANDAAPNYAAELAKCQRYFIDVTTPSYATTTAGIFNQGGNTFATTLPLPVTMRSLPTLALKGTALLRTTSNGSVSITINDITILGCMTLGLALTVSASASSLQAAILIINAGFTLSADL